MYKRLNKKFRQLQKTYPEVWFLYGHWPKDKEDVNKIVAQIKRNLLNYLDLITPEDPS